MNDAENTIMLNDLQNELALLAQALNDCQIAAGLFASVIKSGERWSPECDAALDKVRDTNNVAEGCSDRP